MISRFVVEAYIPSSVKVLQLHHISRLGKPQGKYFIYPWENTIVFTRFRLCQLQLIH